MEALEGNIGSRRRKNRPTLSRPFPCEPGTHFAYNNAGPHRADTLKFAGSFRVTGLLTGEPVPVSGGSFRAEIGAGRIGVYLAERV